MRTRFAFLVAVVSLASFALFLSGCKKEPSKDKADEEEVDKDKDKDEDDDDDDDDDKKKKKKKKKDDDDDDDDDKPAKTERLKKKADDDVIKKFMADKKAKPTEEVLENFVLSLQECDLGAFGPNFRCEAYKKYKEVKRRKSWYRNVSKIKVAVAAKLINHENHTVRHEAVGFMTAFFSGATKKNRDLILKFAPTEEHPQVLAKMISVIGSQIGKDEKVKELLVKNSEHKASIVRKATVLWFTNARSADVEGVFDIALKIVDKDPDIKVRAYACERLYGTMDKRAIKVMKKYTDDKSADVKLYTGCFRGLVNAWIGSPRTKKPNQDAYQHTLKLLKATPRDQDHPPWTIFMPLGWAKEDTKFSHQREWLSKVKGFYKAKKVRKILAEIIVDENVRWLGRTSAVRSYQALGASKKDVKGLKKKLGKGKNDKFVVKEVDRVLKKM